MPQENMNDFMEHVIAYKEAEKELQIQYWVYISIEKKDNNGVRVPLFSYDLPREVYERRRWVIKWRESKLICKYPKENISAYFSFYEKHLGNVPELTDYLRKLTSCKAQITMQQRAIDNYVAYQRANNMFFSEDTDEKLMKIRSKLAVKIANMQRLQQKIEETRKLNAI